MFDWLLLNDFKREWNVVDVLLIRVIVNIRWFLLFLFDLVIIRFEVIVVLVCNSWEIFKFFNMFLEDGDILRMVFFLVLMVYIDEVLFIFNFWFLLVFYKGLNFFYGLFVWFFCCWLLLFILYVVMEDRV